MAAEVDVWRGGSERVMVAIDTVTAIEKSLGDFTFAVRDVHVDARVAWRRENAHGIWSVSGGRRVREPVDSEGRTGLGYVSAAWETPGWSNPVPRPGFAAKIEAGPVGWSRNLSADALVRGGARYAFRLGKGSFGLEAAVDALIGGESSGADVWVGPRLDFSGGPAQGVSLYARWLRGRNPLGLEIEGVLAGFEVSERPTAIAASPDSVEVSGQVAAGLADHGNGSGRLVLGAASPRFCLGLRLAADVDANVLDFAQSGDLWYRYTVGLDRVWGPGRITLAFFHRSNHVLSGPNPVGVTSVNVVELGHDSLAWDRVPEVSRWRGGGLDWRARGGWLASSSFGGERSVHLRGGVRWSIRRSSREWAPFASAEWERGDVIGKRFAVGAMQVHQGWDVHLEWMHDPQWFRDDSSVWILAVAARYGPGGGGMSVAR